MRRNPVSVKTHDVFSVSVPSSSNGSGGTGGSGSGSGNGSGTGGLSITYSVQFTDTSSPAAAYWNWTFYASNGRDALGRSTVQNPVFVYSNRGSYTVSLETNWGTETHTVVI